MKIIKPRRLLCAVLLFSVCACSGGGIAGGARPLTIIDGSADSTTNSPQPGSSVEASTNISQSICIDGTRYNTTEDDEFSQDSALTAMWTQKLPWGRTNNAGTDDAFYTDPSQGFGGYNPVSFSNNAMNLTAEPVPNGYQNASVLSADGTQRHWLSGALTGPPQTYGYVEISAREPNLQGFWPAPLWLYGTSGKQPFVPPAFQELDVNELIGNAFGKSSVQQTLLYGYGSPVNGMPVHTIVNPDPSLNYHSYGVLWTQGSPGTVTFFIDRHATSQTYTASSSFPMIPIISLQVFAPGTYAPPPLKDAPQSMSLQYFRWFQTSNISCSPSDVQT